MTVAVTGASGFLGQRLCSALAARGEHVRALVRRATAFDTTGIEPIHLSGLDDAAALRVGFDRTAAVVHLAAHVHVTTREAGAEARFQAVNVDGTRHVLEAALERGVRHFVLVSSVKAVGESNEVPWTETTSPAPVDPYGRSKLAAERLALDFGVEHGITVTVLRLPLVYGPGATANVLRLLTLVRAGWPLPLGAVHNRRSMLYRDNAIAAILAVLDAGARAGGVFFVSDGVDLSTPELVRTIARAMGRRPRLLNVPLPLLRLAGRLGDVLPLPLNSAEVRRLTGSLAVDNTHIATRIGFHPPIGVEEGWRRTAHWFTTGEER